MTALPIAQADAPPPLARRLGYAGLIPFVLGAALVWFVNPEAHPFALLGLAAYAALIASFLGGVHWGAAMGLAAGAPGAAHAVRALGWGVVPTLVAWPAVLMPPDAGLVVLGALLAAGYAIDRRLYPLYGLRAWLTLRFRLSTIAALSCFLGAAGA